MHIEVQNISPLELPEYRYECYYINGLLSRTTGSTELKTNVAEVHNWLMANHIEHHFVNEVNIAIDEPFGISHYSICGTVCFKYEADLLTFKLRFGY